MVLAAAAAAVVGAADLSAADLGFRIRFGLNDEKSNDWSGTIATSTGRVSHISGWRFGRGDSIDGVAGWKTQTRPQVQQARGNNAKKAAEAAARRPQAKQPMLDNGVIVSLSEVDPDTTITVNTKQGNFTFKPADVPYGAIVEKLDGAVELERTAFATPVTGGAEPTAEGPAVDDDYPAIAVAPDGTTYVAYVAFTHSDRAAYAKLEDASDNPQATANGSRGWKQPPDDFSFLARPVGGDQVMLRVRREGKWGDPIPVTDAGCDVYKCALTIDRDGAVWVVWSQNVSYPKPEADFEIMARRYGDGNPNNLSELINVSKRPGSDLNPAVVVDTANNLHIVWQGLREGRFAIVGKQLTVKDGWTEEAVISTQTRNCWTPAVAAASDGRVAVAWDTYEKGDYDVWVREIQTDGKLRDALPAADTVDYEARPSLTYDQNGNLWIAYELGSPSWGKDSGPYDNGGNPLYRGRQVGLIVRQGDKWVEPTESYITKLPGATPRRRMQNQRVAAIEPGGESPDQARAAELLRDVAYNNLARIACDKSGRIWLLCRSRANDFRFPLLGSLWLSWAVCYDDGHWVGPTLIPNSDNLMYNTPSVAALPGGGLVVAHSTDHRQDRSPPGEYKLAGRSDPFDNDIYLTRLESPSAAAQPAHLTSAKYPPRGTTAVLDVTAAERAAIERCRNQTVDLNGRKLRLIRGEYHRHTEISGDGGNDGPLEDMWRYGLDVAAMDWLGNADHDNGAGREYTWWLIQKTTDAFRIAGRFEPPFTYERSVRYPEGHRNVMFAQRGVRTLPRLPITDRDFQGHAPDTQMLYGYLRHFQGICASHTSATGMGTDWRDNAPDVEPIVEIYQGDRQNYERPGAPRCPTADYSIGGWEPKGFVNLALMKGYKLAFQCSSDHLSTHISYAHVYAEDLSREGLLKAIRERHIYGSTDNIVADFRSVVDGRTYMLGDEFTTAEPPKFTVKLNGTAPFAEVTLVKDDVEIPLPCDSRQELELSWTDPIPTPGKTSYYYIRGRQTDDELVWVSPMWVKYQPKAGAQ